MQPITISRIFAYDGPNIFGPSPGVLLHATANQDRSRRLRAALKDGAQFIGLVIANLHVEARPGPDDARQLIAHFATEAPAIGQELCAYVVAGMTAEIAGDEEWDRDTPLLALQERVRAETLPVAALQLSAEARARGLPSFRRADGRVQLGYGARGWSFDPAPLRERDASLPTPPWAELGDVPVVAITGQSGRAAAVERMAADLGAMGAHVRSLDGAGFDAVRALLADPSAEALVLGLDTAAILRRGLAFDRCALAVITDRSGPRPPEAADDDEWARALGVPMLLSAQPVRINLADAGLRSLIPYAPNGVVGL